MSDFVGRWFAPIVLVAGAIALTAPGAFGALEPAVPWLLALIMFGMGMTLRATDFGYVVRRPGAFLIGLAAQFVVMPGLGWIVATALQLRPELTTGVLLVACSPGGTASNVMVYLSRGDTALSVAMTSVSTLVAPLVTPLLVLGLAGRYLEVGFADLFTSILQVVLLPVLLGVLVRRFAAPVVDRAQPALPLVSVLGITLVVMAVVAGSAADLVSVGLAALIAVVLHNCLGLAVGYGAARVCGLDEPARRAVSIEVGMQNSGLAATLATTHFNPVTALPAAIFSVWHNISGSLVAGYWARRADEAEEQPAS
ncbi:bile acid:sodium symporter family protein [Bounagaea algeriensis]